MGKLYLTCGDYILNADGKDAIVNAANKYMINGSGICGVVYRNAGPELLNYCKAKYLTDMETNEVRITPGFKLSMDILHVLAPKHHESINPIEDLVKGYSNLLKEVLNNNYKNVLMCSLGTGVHGYKHEEVAKKLILILNDFCNIYEVNIYLNNVYPLYKDIYLKEYLDLNSLDLKMDLLKLEPKEMQDYLIEKALIENNIDNKYKDFVGNKDLNDMCLSEKLICLQYTLEHFNVTKEQLIPLINTFE